MPHRQFQLSGPEACHLSGLSFFYQTVNDTVFATFLPYVRQLLEPEVMEADSQSEKAVIEKIVLNEVGKEGYEAFIHLLHITLFVKDRHEHFEEPAYLMPVTEAVNHLLETVSLQSAIQQLPMNLTDVLTAHPVDKIGRAHV